MVPRVDFAARRRYSSIMDKMHTAKLDMSQCRGADVVPGTPAERIGLVWPLTLEVTSLSRRHDAERRLQRHVVTVVRRDAASSLSPLTHRLSCPDNPIFDLADEKEGHPTAAWGPSVASDNLTKDAWWLERSGAEGIVDR